MGSVERLHANFYEAHLDRTDTEYSLNDADSLFRVLWAQLPDEYTGGISFDDWVAADDN